MSPQIAVIGLNQVGASIGQALGAHKDTITRVGHDAEIARMRKLEKEGVFDKTTLKITDAVHKADLVIFSLPIDLLRDAFQIISSEIDPETVIMCFSPISTAVYAWARQILPAKQPFIVLQPALQPQRLRDWDDDLHSAHSGLFENCTMLVVTDSETSGRAFQMANELCALLNAKPYFTDPLEADGIMARVEQLPKLTAAALLSALVEQPGWDDSRRLAARAFFRTASITTLYNEQEYFGISDLMNKENITRAIDDLVMALNEIRDMIEEGDEDNLKKKLQSAKEGYETWIAQRMTGDWEKEKVEPELLERGVMRRLFGGKPRGKKPRE